MIRLVGRAVALCLVLVSAAANATQLTVVSSGGFAAALKLLVPAYTQQSGDVVALAWGPSMGDTPNTVPARLARGETIDVVIMVGYALDDLAKQGKVTAASKVALARSGIGLAVKAGAPHPDITTVDGLKRALLAAPSIAYSDSASGVYIEREMFKTLGIQDQVAGKARMIPAEPVGAVVARGDAALGFQQISELKPIPGIELVGPLPAPVQKYTVFSAGIVATSKHSQVAERLIRFLAAPSSRQAILDSGMEPGAGQ